MDPKVYDSTELAGPGGRHDNDKVDIREVQIMPTYDEIVSSKNPYLPTADPTTWHVHGIDGVIDRQFRLLREDTVGGLRDAVRSELFRLRGQADPVVSDTTNRVNRINSYTNAVVTRLNARAHEGFHFEVEFDQPDHLVELTQDERYEWWDCAKRLRSEHVVCIIDISGMTLFCVVNSATYFQQKSKTPSNNLRRKLTVKLEESNSSNPSVVPPRAVVKLSLIGKSREDIATLLYHYHNSSRVHSNANRSLVEFPRALLPSFSPTLLRLQRMYASGQVACSDLIAPDLDAVGPTTVPLPPKYALRNEFKFNLGCLTESKKDLLLSPQQPYDCCLDHLAQQSTLDGSQVKALGNALTRRVAIVQGPPGTGKSFTGVALIQSLLASDASLRPILTVTYTNHAVDQLLESLLDANITRLVRVGGFSSSERLQSKRLQKLNAWATADEKSERSKLGRELENNIGSRLRTMNADTAKVDSWGSLREFLKTKEPMHFTQMYVSIVPTRNQNQASSGDFVRTWLRDRYAPNHPARPLSALKDVELQSMSLVERHNLFEHWRKTIVMGLNETEISLIERAHDIKSKLTEVADDKSYRALANADVIGLTTSGLAKRISLLRRAQPKVLIIEEAGEVLEAHTLTAFLPSIEHIILIGDHQQLTPHIASYEMSRFNPRGNNVAFDVSLFERLVEPQYTQFPKLPYDTLHVQRRMHPSISQLIRIHQYPQLQDHALVTSYPEIAGLRKRLFWMHHEEVEDRENPLLPEDDPTNTSHSNMYEVSMVTALVRHLVRQGVYKSTDIAILTPYLGQLFRLREALQNLFEVIISDADRDELGISGYSDLLEASGSSSPQSRNLFSAVRLSTVDNFQGEEANVVIISLVRCNKDRIGGFLRTDNRVNVMLSRAKHGMYIIGNAHTTTSKAEMMESTLLHLHRNGLFGDRLELACAKHSATGIWVKHPSDFDRYSPDGGCHMSCARSLPCGHVCPASCHAEHLHKATICRLPCERSKPYCQHSCKNTCGVACETRCSELIRNAPHLKLKLPCGHKPIEDTIECWQLREPSGVMCDQLQVKEIRGCLHKTTVPCSVDVNHHNYKCLQMCGRSLPCGHRCRNICGECPLPKDATKHSKSSDCQQPCGKKLPTCSHTCHSACHANESRSWPCLPCAKCPVPTASELHEDESYSTLDLAIDWTPSASDLGLESDSGLSAETAVSFVAAKLPKL